MNKVLTHFCTGVLIGHRLLKKVEYQMSQQNCVRIMISIPEIRDSMIQWVLHRDFVDVKTLPYPSEAIGQTMVKDTSLVIFQKPLKRVALNTSANTKANVTVSSSFGAVGAVGSKPHPDATATFGLAAHSAASSEEIYDWEDKSQRLPAPAPGKVVLPPHWRVSASEGRDWMGESSTSNISCDDGS